MIVVQAPVAQKVDNSFSTDKSRPVDKIYRFISVVQSLDSALQPAVKPLYSDHKVVHSKVGCVTFIHCKPVVK